MANTFRLKRSAVAAKVPTTGDLQLGELALNTYDGRLYTLKDNGTPSVVRLSGVTETALTFNNGGAGAASGTTFDGSTARTISYNSIGAPSTTGAGASGTWGISITGNAATVTNGVYQNGYGSFQASFTSNIDANVNRNAGVYGSYSNGATNTPTTAGILWNATSGTTGQNDGGQIWQDYISNNLYVRQRWGGNWSASWLPILSSTNFNTYAPTLTGTGASGSWGISITGSSASCTGNSATATSATTATNLAAGGAGTVPYQSGAGATAMLAAGTAGQFFRSGGAGAPSWVTLQMTDIPGAPYKMSCRVATTANITLSGTQTIDGVAVVAGDRVLVKDQSTASQNGIYVVAAGAWTRAADADASAEIASAIVAIDEGTANAGELWTNTFKTTDTLGTTAMTWFEVLYNSGTWGISITGSAASCTGNAATATDVDDGTY